MVKYYSPLQVLLSDPFPLPLSHSVPLKGRRRPNASRELSVLERLGSRVQSGEVALHLGDALAALVTTRRYDRLWRSLTGVKKSFWIPPEVCY